MSVLTKRHRAIGVRRGLAPHSARRDFNEVIERLVDPIAGARRCVEKGHVLLLGKGGHFIPRHRVLFDVRLVGQEHDLRSTARPTIRALANVANPVFCVQKRAAIAQVKDDGDALSAANVGRRDAAESLLARSVPPHDSVDEVVYGGKLDPIVDPNGGNERVGKGLVDVPHQYASLAGARVA